jgi:hypothetical protein
MADHPEPDTTLPDDTRHGPVPPMGPAPRSDPRRTTPRPGRKSPGDAPELPPARAPFPEGSEIEPETDHPKSM